MLCSSIDGGGRVGGRKSAQNEKGVALCIVS